MLLVFCIIMPQVIIVILNNYYFTENLYLAIYAQLF